MASNATIAAAAAGTISQADTLYIHSCTGAVLFMTPGLALFYGGMVRETAATDMMLQNFVALGILSVLWMAVGFSMSFAPGLLVGDLRYAFWNGVLKHEPWPDTHISQELFGTFQMMFAIITPILMTGTFADRMRFAPFLIFITAWSILVYYPWCHQLWGKGYFQQSGVWDFAGGIVVHSTAGWSALATALALGPRKVVKEGKDIAEPHSLPVIVLGTGILWFGWFGFNGGSAMALNQVATTAMTNSHLAAAMACVVWGAIDWLREGQAKLLPLCIAAVAGLVVVTPCCGLIQPREALVAGVIAGTVCYFCIWFLKKINVDDALDVWGVHGAGGAIGTILIGVLADGPECLGDDPPVDCVNPGSVANGMAQIILQAKALGACIVWSFVVTFILIKVMLATIPVKPDDRQFDHLDQELHGEPAYQYSHYAYQALDKSGRGKSGRGSGPGDDIESVSTRFTGTSHQSST
eukprot:TRINITY_DN22327_c0_g1_i2.p1 TRINITY_DN22327_c0_g1~~TRINITY_DN22327_c0_g1_i2.p1  ORF type:complete len:467 (+),score=88.44 TRINITY_DN22327_c0_g1_i2:94-1494(+)